MEAAEGYYDHVRPHICDLVARYAPTPLAKVLDLGCASGRLGEALKALGIASEVDGVELSATAADEARGRLDRVWVADLADFDWAEAADDYGVIIAADVLEHLADPWETLRELRKHLAPEGTIIASIPNVRYWKVIWDLLVRGEFRYVDEGILDRTHLRFFTRASIRRLFADSGYIVDHLAPNPIDRPRLRGAIMAVAGDLAHVQYHVVARAADDVRAR
jgi:2-polyprenyl-3-methyl-5-hydroxy-6-metoxy-1,4-benzoquinol methylase